MGNRGLKENHKSRSITVIPEKCVGCKLCQLICSCVNLRVFNPARAHIPITADEKKGLFDITFLPGCTGCGACIKHCPAGALTGDTSLYEKGNSDG